jgi:hypothetical protein
MRLPWVILLLGLCSAITGAHAASTLSEVKPGRTSGVFVFDIRSDRLPNGDIAFKVRISRREAGFPPSLELKLANVEIVQYSDEERRENPRLPWRTETVRPIRNVSWDLQGRTIHCVFSVTEKELENPYLSFLVTIPAGRMPSIDMHYARLRNFVKP